MKDWKILDSGFVEVCSKATKCGKRKGNLAADDCQRFGICIEVLEREKGAGQLGKMRLLAGRRRSKRDRQDRVSVSICVF